MTIEKPRRRSKADALHGSAFITDFAKSIVKGDVVLLLGPEKLLAEDKDDATADQREILVRCSGSMLEYYNYIYELYHEDCETPDAFFRAIWDSETWEKKPEWLLGADFINPEIGRLLGSRKIRVVLTTVFDPILEDYMRGIWGDDLRVINFYDLEKSNSFHAPDEIVVEEDVPPTLYYLFGKAQMTVSNGRTSDFVYNDNKYVETIKRWIRKPPANLIEFLGRHRMLALGCKLDHWLFRFFWTGVLGRDVDSQSRFNYYIAMSLSPEDPSDVKLSRFIDEIGTLPPEGLRDVSDFTRRLNDEIDANIGLWHSELRTTGGVFLSYCSEDRLHALSLFYKLRNDGIPVWIDSKELHQNDRYDEVILRSIAKCRVFVPLLSRTMSAHRPASDKTDPMSDNFHYYRDVEWIAAENIAEEGSRPFDIMPYSISDYNPTVDFFDPEVRREHEKYIFSNTIDPYTGARYSTFLNKLRMILKD